MADVFGVKAVARFTLYKEQLARQIHRKEVQVLSRTGAFGRGVERKKIRKASKRIRARSQYPRYHGHPNAGLRTIIFYVDTVKLTVRFGPIRREPKTPRYSKRGRRVTIRPVSKTVPQLLNEGGRAQMIDEQLNGRSRRINLTYRPQPYRDDSYEPTLDFMKRLMVDIPL